MSVKTPRLEDFPEWIAQNKRLQELNGRRDAAERRVAALLSERSEAQGSMSGSERQAKARALITGHSVEFTGRTPAHQVEADINAAIEERDTLVEACNLQNRELEHLRDRLSKEICEGLRAHHHQLVLRVAKAMRELSIASAAEHDFRQTLADEGVRYSAWIPVMEYNKLGRIEEPESHVSRYLRDAAEFGFSI